MMAILFLLSCHTIAAQQLEEKTLDGTTITYRYTPIVEDSRTPLERYLDANLDDRNVRFNIIGGPGYSANTGWRLAAIANMYYRQRGEDSTSPGVLTLTAAASLTGYYNLTLGGVNALHGGRHRLSYGLELRSEPTYIWGLDYATATGGSAGEYTAHDYGAWLNYRYAFTRSLFVGVGVNYLNVEANGLSHRAVNIVGNEPYSISAVGVGLSLGVDTRQSVDNRTRGLYAAVELVTHPQLLSSLSSNLYELNVTFDYYQPLWRGATLALDLYGEFHNDATPWLLRAELGGESRMRGYYRGRYMGDHLVAAQLELRQHLWEGLGVAVWGGAGEVFSVDDKFAWRKVLPTYGVGLRWSLNALTSIRLEMAFGRDSRYFILGINEAF